MGDLIVNAGDGAQSAPNGMTLTHSNLRCFLDTVTPVVEAHRFVGEPFLPWSNGHYKNIRDGVKGFYLADLWNRFYEWSVCGVGSSVRLPSGETIVQYFVPYLSAIQVYTNNTNVPALQRFHEYNQHHVIDWTNKNGYETPSQMQTGVQSKGELFFKYYELDSPYERIPFVDKVYELSSNIPDLASLNSVDLSPSSWMSIFWYPINHVPAKNQKDLTTCFLTYHSLSTSEEFVTLGNGHAYDHVALAPFGLATHKLDAEVWASPNSGDQEHIVSLFSAAQTWLSRHGIYHKDFNYFSFNQSS